MFLTSAEHRSRSDQDVTDSLRSACSAALTDGQNICAVTRSEATAEEQRRRLKLKLDRSGSGVASELFMTRSGERLI